MSFPSQNLSPLKPQQYNVAPSAAHTNNSNRKRKAEFDVEPDFQIPTAHSQNVYQSRVVKRSRRVKQPRGLALSRILESLEKDALRNVIESICAANPTIHQQLVQQAPRPSTESCMKLLSEYEQRFQDAFPLGGNNGSDYAYNRVERHMIALLDALKDYTPSFLPPTESQISVSLKFLDGVTGIVHRIPRWNSMEHNRHRNNAYDDLSEAWATVIRESGKQNGGFQFVNAGWSQKLAKHNELSGGKLGLAVQEMSTQVTWLGSDAGCGSSGVWNGAGEGSAACQNILGESFGPAVQVGPW